MSNKTWVRIGVVAGAIVSLGGAAAVARNVVPTALGVETSVSAATAHQAIRDEFSSKIDAISHDVLTIRGMQECTMQKVEYKDCPAVRGQYVRPVPSR